jgi:hypothetical protein
VIVVEYAAADAPHHRPVTPYQGFEGRRLPAAHETLQKLSIGQIRPVPQKQCTAKALDDLADLGRHFLPFMTGRKTPPSILTLPARPRSDARLSPDEMGARRVQVDRVGWRAVGMLDLNQGRAG